MRYATENDERVRRRILPVRVVKTWGNVENAQALLEDKQGEAYLGHYDGCTLTSRADAHAAVLLDFGAEFHGTLRITTEMVNGAVQTVNVRVRFGESASEALAPLGWKGACNDHAERDRRVRAGRAEHAREQRVRLPLCVYRAGRRGLFAAARGAGRAN